VHAAHAHTTQSALVTHYSVCTTSALRSLHYSVCATQHNSVSTTPSAHLSQHYSVCIVSHLPILSPIHAHSTAHHTELLQYTTHLTKCRARFMRVGSHVVSSWELAACHKRYSPSQIGWHRISGLFLKTFDLAPRFSCDRSLITELLGTNRKSHGQNSDSLS